MNYPNHPGHKGPSDTGRLAAQRIAPRAKTIRARTLELIEQRPATAEQVAEQISEHWMVVRARLSELRNQGLVDDSGQRGRGALGGKVVVWRATTAAERAVFLAQKAAEAEHGENPHG